MTRNQEICVVLLCFFLIWIKLTVCSDAALSNTCYCLVEELSNLRNPIHVEATVIGGQNVYLIAEQIGIIWEYQPKNDAHKLRPYLNVSHLVLSQSEIMDEHGLLGFALHPNFRSNKKLFLYSIRTMNDRDVVKIFAVVSEITDTDVQGEKILLAIEQPGTKRNGGQLLFGDDGYLYILVGDGGPSSDLDIQSQNGSSLLGKVLRIDVDKNTMIDFRPRFYDIPHDNPTKNAWRPEVYAIGSRNMWRCGTDKGDRNGKERGRIFCGDLGSSIAEEVNEIQKGADYGWPSWEGNTCRNNKTCRGSENTFPVFEFRRDTHDIRALVGGPVYRQTKFPNLSGQLVVGDFVSGALFTLRESLMDEGTSRWSSNSFPRCEQSRCGCNARGVPRSFLLSFGETHSDELLLLMTDEPAPNRPRGAMLRLESPSGDNVTCSAVNIFTNTIPYFLMVSYSVYLCTISIS